MTAPKRTTLRELLSMTAGWTDSTGIADRDLLRGWFCKGPELEPGKQFRYTNIGRTSWRTS
jgi:CubicO group peptidase (beta-lactamase class C family)